MEEKKKYNSEKDYVLYLSKGCGDPDGFVCVKNSDEGTDSSTYELVEEIARATRLTSVEANRIAVEYQKTCERFPFKLKICNYKDLIF